MTYEIETAYNAMTRSYKALHKRFDMKVGAGTYTKLKEEMFEMLDEDYLTPSWYSEAGDVLYVAVQLAHYNEQTIYFDEFKPTKSWANAIRTAYNDRSFDDLVNVLLNMFFSHNALSYVYATVKKNDAKTPETHVLENGDILRRKVLVTPDEAFRGWVYSPYDSGVVTWEKDKTTIVLSADGLKVMNEDEFMATSLLNEIHTIVTSPIMSKFMVLYNEGKNLKDGVLV